ncbi:KDO2-lipid IV(A) lauroyltransferase [Abditibacterium utsteinense]|uniref:KDO2-lipid IV(A) lauroyltransferase n=1 Tax=Abditibacterium utsteinense TaxID=1960156 RepID=A0A2S8SSG8_9BACT|nr:lysophospholipid acyltransferase family protein [Abditibacterium utsteinense]PQV63679.1 KDO2-lipid IV(A) lauroyltransferase [Abditibacterium utsteinense]
MSNLKQKRTQIEKRVIGRMGRSLERAPWSTCRRVGSFFGLAFYYGQSSRREIAQSNLRLIFPDLSEREVQQLARRSAQNFGMSFCEFLHMRTASKAEIRNYCEWDGLERIQDEFAGGHGVILPTAHFGAWEVMGARAAQDFPLTVVVRLTSNKSLRAHIERVRAAIHVGMIHKNEPARVSMKILHANQSLAIFADQHAGADGLLLPVFGIPTRVHSSPARLALATRAPIIPTFGVRRTPWLGDGRVVITPSPALYLDKSADRESEVLRGTNYVTAQTEAIIRAHPDQWLWMHRRWREGDRQVSTKNEVSQNEKSANSVEVSP